MGYKPPQIEVFKINRGNGDSWVLSVNGYFTAIDPDRGVVEAKAKAFWAGWPDSDGARA